MRETVSPYFLLEIRIFGFMFGISFEFVISLAPLIFLLIYAAWELIPSVLG